MIANFRHSGLDAFFSSGSKAGIRPDHSARLRLILGLLAAARGPRDLMLPGLRLHALHGTRGGRWSVSVNRNWRVTFAFHDGDVVQVDYEDYH